MSTLRAALRCLIGILLLQVVAPAAGAQSEGVLHRWAREQIVPRLDELLPGRLDVGALGGSPFGDLVLYDLTLRYEGITVLRVRRATANLALSQLPRGRIEIERLELEEPEIRLRQDAEGNWNLLDALVDSSAAAPAPTPGAAAEEDSGMPFAIRALVIDGAEVAITPAEADGRMLTVRGLDARGSVALDPAGTRVTVDAISATLRGRALPVATLRGGLTYDGRDGDHIVARDLRVRTAQSALRIDGRYTAEQVDAEVHIAPLAAGDLRAVVPTSPLQEDLSGRVTAAGTLSDLNARVRLSAGAARLLGRAWADLSGEIPRYTARVLGREIRPAQLAPELGVAGTSRLTLQIAGTGTALTAVNGTADLSVDALHAAGLALGDLDVDATLGAGTLAVDGGLRHAGTARFTGEVALDAQRYTLDLRLDDIQAGALGEEAALPDTRLNLVAHVEGAGFDPAQANATARVDIAPSAVGLVAVDEGDVRLAVADGRLRVEQAILRAAGATATLSGALGLAAAQEGELDYDVKVPDLAPWLALADQEGRGAMTLRGTARGRLDRLDASGTLGLTDVAVADNAVERGAVRYDVRNIGTPDMRGTVSTELAAIESAIALAQVDASVELQSGEPLVASVDFSAETTDGAPQTLGGEVRLGADATTVRLATLALALPGGTWRLESPARVVRTADAVAVESLVLRNGPQSITVDGALGREAGEAVQISVEGVDLAALNGLAPDAVSGVRGIVAADLRIAGTLAEPDPSGSVRLLGGGAAIAPLGVRIEDLTLRADADPGAVRIAELSARAGEGRFELDGTVALREQVPMLLDLRLLASRWPLIATDQAEAAVDGVLTATGTLDAPTVQGRVEVVQAVVRPELSLLAEGGPAPRDPTIIVVQERRAAAAADGAPTETAASAFDAAESFENLALNVAIAISDNTWIKHDSASLGLFGEVTVAKQRGEPVVLVGLVRVVQGWIYFRGRRFNPREGEVRFTGGEEVDPVLDIELETRIAGYTIQALVGGTAAEPSLEFTSEPDLEDADILGLLLFGRRVNQLDGGEQMAVEQEAGNIAANFAASTVAERISEQLGLGLVITDVDVADGRFGVGRYLTPDTFVSVSQDLGGTAEREVTIDYYLTPEWSVTTSTDTGGENTADVFWRKKY